MVLMHDSDHPPSTVVATACELAGARAVSTFYVLFFSHKQHVFFSLLQIICISLARRPRGADVSCSTQIMMINWDG